jgi:nucleoside-diphosphate-sugar epimerase
MKALVTGATGFIGSHIVERLLDQGHEVRALARKTSNLRHLKTTNAQIVIGDIEDYDSLVSVVDGIDVVFHAAARVMPGWGRWEDFERETVKGTENLLRASADVGVSRFVYVSSGTVMGEASYCDVPADESTPCEISIFRYDTFYDHAKLQAEKLCLDWHKQGKIAVTVTRPCMVYGPRDRLLSDKTYRQFDTTFVVWPGKSNPRTAIVHVTDVADCILLAATSDKAAGEIYNIAPTEVVWFRDYGNAMIRALGGRKIQMTIPYSVGYLSCFLMEGWAHLKRQKELPYLTRSGVRFLNQGMHINGSKARRELGWEPKISIEEGTKQYVAWRREQEKKK